tara:strand:+ start:11907 stop:12092 length:186 start_codon:yes stop_codon:yes gene_type:complete
LVYGEKGGVYGMTGKTRSPTLTPIGVSDFATFLTPTLEKGRKALKTQKNVVLECLYIYIGN